MGGKFQGEVFVSSDFLINKYGYIDVLCANVNHHPTTGENILPTVILTSSQCTNN